MIRQANSSHPKIPQADGAADIFDDCDMPGPSSSSTSGSKAETGSEATSVHFDLSITLKKKKRNSKKNARIKEKISSEKVEVLFVPQVDGATGLSDDEDDEEVRTNHQQ